MDRYFSFSFFVLGHWLHKFTSLRFHFCANRLFCIFRPNLRIEMGQRWIQSDWIQDSLEQFGLPLSDCLGTCGKLFLLLSPKALEKADNTAHASEFGRKVDPWGGTIYLSIYTLYMFLCLFVSISGFCATNQHITYLACKSVVASQVMTFLCLLTASMGAPSSANWRSPGWRKCARDGSQETSLSSKGVSDSSEKVPLLQIPRFLRVFFG